MKHLRITLVLIALASSQIPVLVFGEDETPVRISRFGVSANGYSLAVKVGGAPLVHTTQLLPASDDAETGEQIATVLSRLDELLAEFQSSREDVIRLNVYLREADLRPAFLKGLQAWCPEERFPAVSFSVTPLPRPEAGVALDAVFASRREAGQERPVRLSPAGRNDSEKQSHAAVLPRGDAVYVSGQAQPGDNLRDATSATLQSLGRTLESVGASLEDVVQVKCFLTPMTDVAVVNRELHRFFGESPVPPVSHVEWISGSRPIEIELVAWAPAADEPAGSTVSYLTPPGMTASPVFSRVARVHSPEQIYVSSLFAAERGEGAEQVRSVFDQLGEVLAEAGSDFRHLAKATYYVSDDDASRQLNVLRPTYYDPQRPPAASKALVQQVALPDRTLAIDMIATPAGESSRSR
jgi:enamine deaminase RidA (YjgF/YER057c/UK114 family)